MISASPSHATGNRVESPVVELAHPAAHGPDPQLRAWHVLEHRHLAPHALGGGSDPVHRFGVLVRLAVREIEPGHVHALNDHLLEHFGLPRGRPHGGDDLRGAHC
jgi:hypothetical protein